MIHLNVIATTTTIDAGPDLCEYWFQVSADVPGVHSWYQAQLSHMEER